MTDEQRIIEEVTQTSISLLLKEPFFSHFFSALNKEVVSFLDTLGVGLRDRGHVLYINAGFWDNFLTDKAHRYGVVKHEVLHIVLKHTLVNQPRLNRHVVNIAMDIVVNQYIDKRHLPKESVFLENFPELMFEPDASWKYYYEKLMHLRDHLDTLYLNTTAAASFSAIRENDQHKLWNDIYTQTNIEKDLMDAGIDNLIHIARAKTTEKSYGTLPAGFKSYLDSILYKSKPLVDWRRVLKIFSESSSKTKVTNTLKRPSKRYGTSPGIKIRKLRKLLIAVDTSGSIHQEEIAQFFTEIHHIWRQGSEIIITECDAKIQRTYSYKGTVPTFIIGGGGTNFDAPIEYGNKHFKPDGLIYFTDGVAPSPQIKPRYPLLWVISNEGITTDSEAFRNLPGRKARL